jgi:uncharacterized protein YfaS (alpha-2-macroglobulin family)
MGKGWAGRCGLGLGLGMAGAALLLAASTAAQAARVTRVSPQGEVAEVRQVAVAFDEAVVPAGDPRRPAPYTLECAAGAAAASTPAGDARWVGADLWVYDLRQPLAAGTRCTLRLAPGFTPLKGTLQAPAELRFNTGGLQVVEIQPGAGTRIDEDQHFLLRTNAAVDPASLAGRVWCEVEGLGERIAVTAVQGATRAAVLAVRERGTPPEKLLLLACQRPFPADAGVRLVFGAGVAAAGQPGVVTRSEKRFEWKVRQRFAAEFSCERENASAPCLPLRPLTLRFNAPVPRALALAARLKPPAGEAIAPRIAPDNRDEMLSDVQFAAPLAENTKYQITLPAELRDEAGRGLSNAATFPLTVATGGMPPLAKFAGAPFGIVEAGDAANPALLPFTLRHVQADLAGASTGGQIRVRTLGAATTDAAVLGWIARLQRYHERELTAREAGLPASQWTVVEREADERGRLRDVKRDRRVGTREVSLLAQDSEARRSELPQLKDSAPRATEVIGLPLQQPGYHVVEIESRVLGNSLLATRAPMYVRTGALVTNLGVHFKRGRASSLVWVTTLDRSRPVAGAKVAVNDCRGMLLWSGSTDANGIARIDRGFDEEYGGGDDEGEGSDGNASGSAPRSTRKPCVTGDGMFVTARSGNDLSFVFSRWQRGIESWRFNIGTASGTAPNRHAHTVFDRTLLRAGELLSMKHFLRDDTLAGTALPPADALPGELVITHVGSGAETVLPLAWPRGARAAESTWQSPKNAALGMYFVELKRGSERWPSGNVRIEAFRVPLVDARLSAPSGEQVAPAELNFAAQLNALAGGPMAALPLKLSALLTPASPRFAGYEDFGFNPPEKPRPEGRAQGDTDAEADSDSGRLVADRLPSSTDARGAATIKIAKLPALTGPSDLRAELSFSDPNGEVQTVTQSLRLWPSRVVVGVRAPSWAAARGEAAFDAVVLDTSGKPLKGREVTVAGRVKQVLSTRKRIVGGFYAYDNNTTTRELGQLCSGKTDAQGRLACTVKVDATGEVEVVARASDDAGRASEAATTVWVSGQGEWWFAQDNDDRIDLLPEKREVEPGQTARLQVRMPFRQATALVTVEREGVIDARVMQLSGREPVIELPIPTGASAATGSWAPNVTVSVLVLRGRLREAPWWSVFTWGWKDPAQWWQAFRYEGRDWRAPTALVDLAKPTYKLGAAQLKVGLAEHRLDVSVKADKAQYAVRETVKAVVRVTHAGKPLAGTEVAFVAVDEGLLALQPNRSWELLEAMMQTRPWGVETATAQGEIIGRRHYGRKAVPPGGGGGRNPTRELFDTLLLWRGTVLLDAQGEAKIDVPLNDSLTSFRLVAIADAGGAGQLQRFGSGSTSVRVSQDLQMLSGLGPLAREGDRFDAGFTLRNTTTRAMTVKATLAGRAVMNPGAGPAVATSAGSAGIAGSSASAANAGSATAGAAGPAIDTAPQTVQLAAGAAVEVRWPVTVPEGASRIDWQAEAVETAATGSTATAAARDRLKLTQAVQPAVPARVWQATLQPLEGTLNWPLAPPEGALPGVGGVVATLQPRLTGALPGLRRYFETYPYTCLEQKTSRAIALRDTAAWQTLGGEVAGYLDADGLAGYFPPQAGDAARGSDRLTAHLLAAAHEAGWAWPAAAREAMLGGLAAFVEGRIERRFNAPRADLEARKLAALDALARHGRAQARMLGSVVFTAEAMGGWPTSSLLNAWSVLRRVDGIPEGAARLEQVQRLLRSRLVEGGTTLKFSTEAEDDWWWLMDSPDANAARLLLAAAEQPAWQGDVGRLLNGTLARQRGGAWRTTTANLWGVLALERVAAKLESVPVAGRSSVQSGGITRTQDWQASPAGATLSLPWPQPAAGAAPGGSAVTARHDGAGRPWLTLQSLAAVPLKAPLFAGYRITRSVSAVERKKPDVWSRGDTLRVRLEVEAVGDMAWVVVNDPVPAGATLLGSGLGRDSAIATRGEKREGSAWLAFEERAADSWRGYYEWLPRGRHVVEYTLRLNASGRFNLPPSRVEAMYAPETFGELPNAAMEVQP